MVEIFKISFFLLRLSFLPQFSPVRKREAKQPLAASMFLPSFSYVPWNTALPKGKAAFFVFLCAVKFPLGKNVMKAGSQREQKWLEALRVSRIGKRKTKLSKFPIFHMIKKIISFFGLLTQW